jgi:peptidoglycan hydrolase CwlO-like protein
MPRPVMTQENVIACCEALKAQHGVIPSVRSVHAALQKGSVATVHRHWAIWVASQSKNDDQIESGTNIRCVPDESETLADLLDRINSLEEQRLAAREEIENLKADINELRSDLRKLRRMITDAHDGDCTQDGDGDTYYSDVE